MKNYINLPWYLDTKILNIYKLEYLEFLTSQDIVKTGVLKTRHKKTCTKTLEAIQTMDSTNFLQSKIKLIYNKNLYITAYERIPLKNYNTQPLNVYYPSTLEIPKGVSTSRFIAFKFKIYLHSKPLKKLTSVNKKLITRVNRKFKMVKIFLSYPKCPFTEPNCPFTEPNCPFTEPNYPFTEPNCPFTGTKLACKNELIFNDLIRGFYDFYDFT